MDQRVAIDSQSIVIGSGMAGLTTASLLSGQGQAVTVLEQNWLPGGCASAYPRKGYTFESGATTLVGLDEGMPLAYLLEQTGIDLPARSLPVPMRVHFPDGQVLTRHQDLDAWIEEAERFFGPAGQRPFWEECYRISRFVWDTSLQQRAFPPSNVSDLWYAARHFRLPQIAFALKAFQSTEGLLRKHGLHQQERFVRFVNEQLLITAQNYLQEVNVLFGATALCYTNYGNYYLDGGMLTLAQALSDYIETHGGQVRLRQPVASVRRSGDGYEVVTDYRGEQQHYRARQVVSAIPINNTLELWQDERLVRRKQARTLPSESLNSAFQLSLVFKRPSQVDCLHHQIHLAEPLPYTGSHSIFLSLSHPEDTQRCGPDELVASVSTHVPDPANRRIEDKQLVIDTILDTLDRHGLVPREDVTYLHASTPGAWTKWTARKWGFVGGYPQYMRIKPWQMLDARFDHHGAYLCGDSTYPGQGIPGACLSGIIAYEKMRLDGRVRY